MRRHALPLAFGAMLSMTLASSAAAEDSAYTKLDFKHGCVETSRMEEGGSVTMTCKGYRGLKVYFAEGDLRHSLAFGPVRDAARRHWQSFGQWNRVNDTVEWRIRRGRPFAAIVRWFIDNIDPETGSADAGRIGQVLVVAKVATVADPVSCFVGFVDARANPHAGLLARRIADTMAATFVCDRDTPRYHGIRGPLAGEPS